MLGSNDGYGFWSNDTARLTVGSSLGVLSFNGLLFLECLLSKISPLKSESGAEALRML